MREEGESFDGAERCEVVWTRMVVVAEIEVDVLKVYLHLAFGICPWRSESIIYDHFYFSKHSPALGIRQKSQDLGNEPKKKV